MNGIVPPIQIVAAGICPQNLAAGKAARDVVGALVVSGGTGVWLITVNDPTVLPDTSCALILSPGSGSNISKGISFGQSQPQTVDGLTQFSFSTYRNDTGAAVDLESQFIIVRWPPGADL